MVYIPDNPSAVSVEAPANSNAEQGASMMMDIAK